MKTYCPHCKQECDLEEEYIKRNSECETCGKEFVVQKPKIISIFCPYCNQNYEIEIQNIGRNAECEICKNKFIIQKPEIISIFCQNCNQNYEIEIQNIGRNAECEICKNKFIIQLLEKTKKLLSRFDYIASGKKLNFTAIDFETARRPRWSVCQVGIVVVENSKIINKISHLVQPPDNKYLLANSLIHGINSEITKKSPLFSDIWNDLEQYISNNLIVAHNISFDIDCLYKTLDYYKIKRPNFITDCTYELTGLNLKDLCKCLNIELSNHHNTIYDARACAEAYIKIQNGHEPDLSKVEKVERESIFVKYQKHEQLKGDIFKPDLEHAGPNSSFYNQKVFFTGALSSMTRKAAAKILKKLGANIDSTLTKKTNFAVVGKEPGPVTMRKIEKYNNEGSNIKVLYEKELLSLIN